MAMQALFEYLSILHPIMPSITSYLAKYFKMHECLTAYKYADKKVHFSSNHTNTLWCLIDEVRSLKGLLNISGGAMLTAYIKVEPELENKFDPYLGVLSSMARFSSIESLDSDTPPKNSLPCVVQGATLYVAFDTALDTISAKNVLSQKKETLEKEAQHLEKKLQNEAYKSAKPEQWQEDSDLLKFKHVESKKLTHFIGLLE